MRTTVGCLVWILVFVAVLLLERDQLQRLPALPRDTLLDGPLAFDNAISPEAAARICGVER